MSERAEELSRYDKSRLVRLLLQARDETATMRAEFEVERERRMASETRLEDEVSALRGRLEDAGSEALEQARLNGMGGEREVAKLGRVRRLERDLATLRHGVEHAVDWFEEYADNHVAKGKDEKARRNYSRADFLRGLLGRVERRDMDTTRTHELKTWPEFFEAVVDGRKTFEVRKNDRDFRVGEALVLREWDPAVATDAGEEGYTGRSLRCGIAYVMAGGRFGVGARYCVLGIEVLPEVATDGA